jgi:uncharacterized protein YndB with AHSA1/START domain
VITLTDSIEVRAAPEKVFRWLTNLKQKADYQSWHPDHVDLRWTKGEPFAKGSIAYFEEYIHGKLHKFTFLCTKVVPDKLIEYRPLFPWSIFMPKGTFVLEPKGQNSCTFTATISLRVGPLYRKLVRSQLQTVKQHMKEEGEILKKILEGTGN